MNMANSGGKILLATAAGLAVGIGIGMLIAPAKGSKTRKRLKKKIVELADLIQEDLSGGLSDLTSAFDGPADEAEDAVAPAEEKEVQ
jgi:Flp pilus assembly protein TadB